ncbi:MAG: carboxypeptidase regulatory-like domain-containing protein [Candidatus Sumerlaeia bacterium]|nr:carboxypeptidase regulatory-like domain-containing protein [Candidatus Sumerlaeia bacterium]
MHKHRHESEQEYRLAVVLLLLALGVVLLVFWLRGRDGRGGVPAPRRDTPPAATAAPNPAPDPAPGEGSGSDPATAEGDGTPAADPADDGELFPSTEESETTSGLALARSLGSGAISGWVVQPNGRPVSAGRVRATFLRAPGEEPSQSLEPEASETKDAETNEDGRFLIEALPVGYWSLAAELEGFGAATLADAVVPLGGVGGPVTLTLSPAASINGAVQTIAKSPIADASLSVDRLVRVYSEGGSPHDIAIPLSARASTGADGKFALRDLPPKPVRIRTVAEGFAPDTRARTATPAGLAETIVLEPVAPLAGVVRAEAGGTIEGATVRARPRGDAKKELAKAASGADGAYALGGLRAGLEVDLHAEAPGYAPLGPVPAVAGTGRNVLTLGYGGAINGVAEWLDRTGDPPAGLAVEARLEGADPPRSWTTRTRDDGRFRLRGLPAGKYDVALRDPKLVVDPPVRVEVAAGKPAPEAKLRVYEGLAFEVRVLEESSRQPIPGARALVKRIAADGKSGALYRDALADEAGVARLANVPAGPWRLGAEAPGFTASAQSTRDLDIRLVRGTELPLQTVTLARAGRIEGVVLLPEGGPAPGAHVELMDASKNPPSGSLPLRRFAAEADSGGAFSIQDLPAVNALSLIVAATAADGRRGASDPLTLNLVEPEASVAIVVDGGGRVAVLAQDREGRPVADAKVELDHAEYRGTESPAGWRGRTDTAGAFEAAGVPPGRVGARVSREGFVSATGSATLSLDRPATIRVILEPAYPIAGRVVDDLQRPIGGALVRASPEAPARGTGVSETDNAGDFAISGLGAGKFRLRVEARFSPAPGDSAVVIDFPGQPSGGTLPTPLVVPCNGAAGGRVFSQRGLDAIAKGSIALSGKTSWGANYSAKGKIDAGAWEFTRLPPGRYTATATAEGHLPTKSAEFDVASPERTTVPDLYLTLGGRVRVRVVDDGTGEPVQAALATAVESGRFARTAANGEAVIAPLEAGIHTISVTHPDYEPAERSGVQVVTRQPVQVGPIRLKRGVELTGRVLDDQRRPVIGARVGLRRDGRDDRRTTNTDRAGRFKFRGVPLDDWLVTATARLGPVPTSRTARAQLSERGPNEVEIILDAASTLRGLLAAPPPVELGGAFVEVYPLAEDGTPELTARANPPVLDGGFELAGIPEGRYLVLAQARDGGGVRYWHREVDVAGPLTEVLVDSGTAAVSGAVFDRAQGDPVPGAGAQAVLLSAPQSGIGRLARWWRREVAADAAGAFRFDALMAGEYLLSARDERSTASGVFLLPAGGFLPLVAFLRPAPYIGPADGAATRQVGSGFSHTFATPAATRAVDRSKSK